MEILRFKEVAKRLGITIRTIERKLKVGGPYHDPAFPRAVQYGASLRGVVDIELDAYIRGLIEIRDADPDQPPDAEPVEAA